jgi:hypothetical protein
MFVLLKDVGLILGLRLDGPAVTGMVDPQNWKDLVEEVTGHRPPDPEGRKEKKTSGVSSAWLWQRFNRCPPHAPDAVMERYAKVWLWHNSCFQMLLGTPCRGWSYHSYVSLGST